MLTIALDIGGTFTDLIAFDQESGTIHHAKSSTTPYDLAVGIRETLAKSRLVFGDAHSFVHGSTIAINTAIERTGAKTALFVTQGMRDVYKIGRGNRPESYNLFFKRPVPLVPRHLTFEVTERLNAAGEVVTAFDTAQALEAAAQMDGCEAAAVCFLHSWANPEHERRMGEVLPHDKYVSLSHEILREYREYERTSTTVLNAYIGPRVSRYLQQLEDLLHSMGFAGQLHIMQSNGGIMSPETAKKIPVAMMESGPVGGIIAAAEVGRELGIHNVIAFDMGGTTAKCSLVQNNQPDIAQGYFIGGAASGQPVMLPVVDIVEVGAGGGSIAWIDEVGALKVGPRSAGGHPGPICYGQGGTEPTVTDANVVLGRISSNRFLGGEMPLDVEAARRGIAERVAQPLHLSVEEAALGIIKIAVAEMSLAVRAVSVERGYDPRDFALVVFGGAGPVHGGMIARELHIPRAVIPRVPGHFSALGMLLADLRHDYVRTYYKPLLETDFGEIERLFGELIHEGRGLLASEGVAPAAMTFNRFLDVRYVGQEFSIPTPVDTLDRERIRAAFDDIHDRRYGHAAAHEPVEVVNVRLTALGRRDRLQFPDSPSSDAAGEGALLTHRDIVLDDPDRPVSCPIYDRDLLASGQEVAGPAVIWEYASTTLLFAGDRLRMAATGEMIIEIGSE
jgi:N-methylhydantoinase A